MEAMASVATGISPAPGSPQEKDDLFELISLHPVAGKQVLAGLCRLSEQRSEHTRFHEHTAFWTFPMNSEPETFPPSHPYAFAVEGKVAEGGRFKGRVPPKFNFVKEWLPAVLAPAIARTTEGQASWNATTERHPDPAATACRQSSQDPSRAGAARQAAASRASFVTTLIIYSVVVFLCL